MHFALPPRKSSHPPPYARPNRSVPLLKRPQLRLIAVIALGVCALLYGASHLFVGDSGSEKRPAGTPDVVIVTLFDHESMSPAYVQKIIDNREDYAKRHGKIGESRAQTTID